MTDQQLPTAARPALGETVHYQAHGSADGSYPPACRAATVTDVGQWITTRTLPDPTPSSGAPPTRMLEQQWEQDAVALHVTNPTGVFVNGGIVHDGAPQDRAGGTWHWPGECRR